MATWLIWHLLGLYPGLLDSSLNCYSPQAHVALTLLSGILHRQKKKKVPGTSELLIVSPMIPKYTVHNRYLNTSTTVTVEGFDARSLQATIPRGVAAYVQSVRVNAPNNSSGSSNVTTVHDSASLCHFDFYDTFRVGADIVITVTADRDAANNCGPGASIPQSISTGGFAMVR